MEAQGQCLILLGDFNTDANESREIWDRRFSIQDGGEIEQVADNAGVMVTEQLSIVENVLLGFQADFSAILSVVGPLYIDFL